MHHVAMHTRELCGADLVPECVFRVHDTGCVQGMARAAYTMCVRCREKGKVLDHILFLLRRN